MKVIVIGSNGFIGSHCYRYFEEKNCHVTGADIINPMSQRKFVHLERSGDSFSRVFKNAHYDICINASGNGSVPVSINEPVFDFELNVLNTVKVLDAIRVYNPVCKYVNLSSAAVYGNPELLPIAEDAELRPLSPYGWHKLYSEKIIKEYYYLYGINSINLRLFSIYGEGLRKQIFWDIFQRSRRSERIELFGSGKETRDFLYISDLMLAMEKVIQYGLFNGESVNIGSGIDRSIEKVSKVFCNFINESITVTFNKIVKPGDPQFWRADISKLKDFGFEPRVSIEDGLLSTVKWLKGNK